MSEPTTRLHQAVELLREASTALNGQRWTADHHPEGTIVRPADSTQSLFQLHADGLRAAGTPCVTPAVGAWIALMHPGVGEALAAWLEAEARRIATTAHPDWHDVLAPHALAVADALLGPETP
jgi:hypothetical protein